MHPRLFLQFAPDDVERGLERHLYFRAERQRWWWERRDLKFGSSQSLANPICRDWSVSLWRLARGRLLRLAGERTRPHERQHDDDQQRDASHTL